MFYTIALLLGFLSSGIEAQSSNKVSLGVYYETLCPDSIRFITTKLYPTIQSLGLDQIDLNLVPFGKASWTESGTDISFVCQHGPRECNGNKVQACAKSKLDTLTLLQLVNCMESADNPDLAGSECAKKLGINGYNDIEKCSTGSEGAQLLKAQGQATKALSPRVTFIPWITLNNVHSGAIQNGAFSDLKGLLCDSFPAARKPSGCN